MLLFIHVHDHNTKNSSLLNKHSPPLPNSHLGENQKLNLCTRVGEICEDIATKGRKTEEAVKIKGRKTEEAVKIKVEVGNNKRTTLLGRLYYWITFSRLSFYTEQVRL